MQLSQYSAHLIAKGLPSDYQCSFSSEGIQEYREGALNAFRSVVNTLECVSIRIKPNWCCILGSRHVSYPSYRSGSEYVLVLSLCGRPNHNLKFRETIEVEFGAVGIEEMSVPHEAEPESVAGMVFPRHFLPQLNLESCKRSVRVRGKVGHLK